MSRPHQLRRALILAAAATALLLAAGCTASGPGAPPQGPVTSLSSTSSSTVPSGQEVPASDLDPTVAALLQAWNAGDQEAFVAQFAPDAVLVDGSRRYEGTEGIREAASTHVTGYRVRVLTPEPMRPDGQTLLVEVTGTQGGSGFEATFDFTVSGGLITATDWQYA